MQTPNSNQIRAEVFSLLMQQLEPWKVAHFWATCQLGTGDHLKIKHAQADTENLDTLIEEIKDFQNKRV